MGRYIPKMSFHYVSSVLFEQDRGQILMSQCSTKCVASVDLYAWHTSLRHPTDDIPI